MTISVFEIFKIGIGPSSSHTVGPMKAANDFISKINDLSFVNKIVVDLYGSLALTGKGHGTDKAVIMGLTGEKADTIDTRTIESRMKEIINTQELPISADHHIHFNYDKNLLFHYKETLPKHSNGIRFSAFDKNDQLILSQIYYSIGGGFIVTDEEFGHTKAEAKQPPYPFETAAELMALCKQHSLTISELVMENEKTWRPEAETRAGILRIAKVMEECVKHGCETPGILPGGLNVQRRAHSLHQKLLQKGPTQHTDIMNWINVFALAVSEENAAGSRIVTAPTNGAAGIIPAVLQYYKTFCDATEEGVITFLLTANAIAILYKLRASISGAEVGCQGEVGVACSMAAGALAASLGGTLEQIENAAEIGMEHNLGLPCDPPKGLVQIPCIERNAMGSVKAINAARLALEETGEHKVSLDAVIATMNQLGKDMSTIYKETSLGGLAVNMIEC